jgi:hypothetical protein
MTEQSTIPPHLDGPPVNENPAFEDYWGFEDKTRWYFPDGKQWIEHKRMNEGDKAKFQRKTTKDFIVERQSGDARMKVDPAAERWELLKTCVVDWFIYRNGRPEPFSPGIFDSWLQHADPKIIESLEKEIRKNNPWLLQNMSSEDIQKEIDNLLEMKEVAIEREKGEDSSGTR